MKRWSLFLAAWLVAMPAWAAKLPYSYFLVGNATDKVATPTPGIVLMGGGTDVDDAFRWMCDRSGGGDFLVIRATGTDAYNPYIRQLCPGLNSVATLIIPTITAANDPRVRDIMLKAEAIWIAGGDQSDYINDWKGTLVQQTLNARIAAGVPVGGTSAGLNVLTQFVYTAQAAQGVTSSQALADPFNRYMSFDHNFVTLPILDGIIGDPHFATRDRMGRDIAFLCRVYSNGWSSLPQGLSVDEETALLIDETTGASSVVGKNHVYFLKASGAPQVCASKKPLTYRNIAVYRIDNTGSFDVDSWTGQGGLSYTISADAGVLSSSQAGGSPY